MRSARRSINYLLGFTLVLSMWSLSSIGFQASPDNAAPTPGEMYKITPDELKSVQDKAVAGDVPAINRLIDYYMLYVGSETEGMIWLERLGDTGDLDARGIVLRYLQRHPQPGTPKHLEELRKRWNLHRK